MAKAEGYYKEHPTREIAILQLDRGTPTDNSHGFRFGNFTQTMMAQREEVEAVFTGKKTPQAGDGRCGAARQRDPAPVREAQRRQVLTRSRARRRPGHERSDGDDRAQA